MASPLQSVPLINRNNRNIWICLRVKKGTEIYSNSKGESYIRRNGSVHRMTADMMRQALDEQTQNKMGAMVEQAVKKIMDTSSHAVRPGGFNISDSMVTPGGGSEQKPDPITLDDNVITQLVSMGFAQMDVLNTLYEMKKQGTFLRSNCRSRSNKFQILMVHQLVPKPSFVFHHDRRGNYVR